ncbi:MAG: methyltransferase domain-containing protein [Promethearchaeota archaeon]
MKDNFISKQDKKYLSIIRHNVNSFISKLSKKYNQEGKLLLDIAPQNYEGAKGFFKKCIIKTLDINPDSNADYIADICKNNRKIIPDNTFDYILCTEVLEHTLNPFKAVNEIYRILKHNGLAFISVPFNFRIHGPLPDCWRFTKYGLESLLNDFEILEIDEIPTPKRNLMPIHYTVIVQKI